MKVLVEFAGVSAGTGASGGGKMVDSKLEVVKRSGEDVGGRPVGSNDIVVGVNSCGFVAELEQQNSDRSFGLEVWFVSVVAGLSGQWVVGASGVADVIHVGTVVAVVVVCLHNVVDPLPEVGFFGDDTSEQHAPSL